MGVVGSIPTGVCSVAQLVEHHLMKTHKGNGILTVRIRPLTESNFVFLLPVSSAGRSEKSAETGYRRYFTNKEYCHHMTVSENNL